MRFEVKRQVRFADCDPAGIVFYPRYFEMINSSIEDWFDHGLDYGFNTLIRQDGFGVPLAHISVDFQAPSQLDDKLDISLFVQDVGRSSIKLTVTAKCKDELRFVALPVLVFIKSQTGKPARIPNALKNKMLSFQEVL